MNISLFWIQSSHFSGGSEYLFILVSGGVKTDENRRFENPLPMTALK
jgi:hypothetical protein